MNGLQGWQALFQAASDEMTWNASTDVDEDSAREPWPQELDITNKQPQGQQWSVVMTVNNFGSQRASMQERHPFHQESFGWSWKNEVRWCYLPRLKSVLWDPFNVLPLLVKLQKGVGLYKTCFKYSQKSNFERFQKRILVKCNWLTELRFTFHSTQNRSFWTTLETFFLPNLLT